jgi:hypothetical protein
LNTLDEPVASASVVFDPPPRLKASPVLPEPIW